MKQEFSRYGILAPGSSALPTIPVRCLNEYVLFLNRCIQEGCTQEALRLYNKEFVKVTIICCLHLEYSPVLNRLSNILASMIHTYSYPYMFF